MPDGPDRLKKKFMKQLDNGDTDDGIGTCFNIIEQFGGKIAKGGMILVPKVDNYPVDVHDAIDYLCLEWDYAFKYVDPDVLTAIITRKVRRQIGC